MLRLDMPFDRTLTVEMGPPPPMHTTAGDDSGLLADDGAVGAIAAVDAAAGGELEATTAAGAAVASSDAAEGEKVTYDMEFLLDLRSKLLMMEIPEAVEVELNAAAMIAAFTDQLEVLSGTVDAIRGLNAAGHSNFQSSYRAERPFRQGTENPRRPHGSRSTR